MSATRSGAGADPSIDGFAITPSDANTLISVTRGIYVGTTGDVGIQFLSGNNYVFSTVPAGMILPVRALKVFESNTTASNLGALL